MNFKLNTVGKDYIIGDLHGCYDLLIDKIEEVDFDIRVDRLFSVGDLIDRGARSVDCLNLLREPWFFAVRGNHEDMMIDAVLNNYSISHWLQNGGNWSRDVSTEVKEELANLILEKMPYAITVETVNGLIGICHAQPPSVDWSDAMYPDEYEIQLMTWGRSWIRNSMGEDVQGIYKTFHGHTALKEVCVMGNVNFIDTGAVFETGKLTFMELK